MKRKRDTKLVAVRRPVNVGRPMGKIKLKMIPYGEEYADRIAHTVIVKGVLMMEVPVARDEHRKQIKFLKGEYRGLKKETTK